MIWLLTAWLLISSQFYGHVSNSLSHEYTKKQRKKPALLDDPTASGPLRGFGQLSSLRSCIYYLFTETGREGMHTGASMRWFRLRKHKVYYRLDKVGFVWVQFCVFEVALVYVVYTAHIDIGILHTNDETYLNISNLQLNCRASSFLVI